MRNTTLAAALAGLAGLTGCVPVLSLRPLVSEKEAVLERAVSGTWQNAEGAHWAILGRPDAAYDIVVTAPRQKTEIYRARLARLGAMLFADISTDSDEPLAVPCHMLARVRLEGDTLRVALFGTDWLSQRIAARGTPAHERLGDHDMLLTAPAADLQKLLLEFAAEPRAFQEETVLHRLP